MPKYDDVPATIGMDSYTFAPSLDTLARFIDYARHKLGPAVIKKWNWDGVDSFHIHITQRPDGKNVRISIHTYTLSTFSHVSHMDIPLERFGQYGEYDGPLNFKLEGRGKLLV